MCRYKTLAVCVYGLVELIWAAYSNRFVHWFAFRFIFIFCSFFFVFTTISHQIPISSKWEFIIPTLLFLFLVFISYFSALHCIIVTFIVFFFDQHRKWMAVCVCVVGNIKKKQWFKIIAGGGLKKFYFQFFHTYNKYNCMISRLLNQIT